MISLLTLGLLPALAFAETLPADSGRGGRLFESEHCVECHSVMGKGARTAPDLGRRLDRDYTPATLASTMWNHAPTMWRAMRARNVGTVSMDDQSAADLFAYFYSARYFEKPGDAGRGKRLFSERTCAECHGLTEFKNPAALPVSRWPSLGNAIALTAAMWNHSASMGKDLVRKGGKWPELSGQDLTDLLVYLRNLSVTKDQESTFQTTAGEGGEALFAQKGCVRCHFAGSSPATWHLQGKTLTDMAAEMWTHGLRMPTAAIHLEPDEMREILSYAWFTQFFSSSGDAARGKRVFTSKRCATCHEDANGGAPTLVHTARPFSGITMVSALWRHGPTMLALMSERNIAWPRFDAREMSDLIAYLNTRKPNDRLQNEHP